jgi:predicted dehydrogenase
MEAAMNSRNEHRVSRRRFLQQAGWIGAGAVVAPTFIPGSALGQDGRPAPSERIVIGCVGVGGMGSGNMNSFLNYGDAQVVAVCDVDANHRQSAMDAVNNKYNNKDCKGYDDFRELVTRKDIDAISLATPDHWHSLPAILAANNGKDIYGEKPLSHTFAEGRAMCDAVAKNKRIWQTGSWQRSQENFRFASELVLNGRIGKVHTVEVGLPVDGTVNNKIPLKPQTPPENLDWNFWLGPAPVAPYQPERVHFHWRWNLDYGGGALMDWIGHHNDIAHWGLGYDLTGPISVEGEGEYQDVGIYNTAYKFRCIAKYRTGVEIILAGSQPDIPNGTRWIGDDGWVYVDRGKIDAEPHSLLEEKIGPDEINLDKSPGHHREFLDSIKSRKPTLTPAEVAHRSATPGHLAQIAMLLGRKIQFNPDTEEIIGDPEASAMLKPSMRAPWSL